MPKLGTVVSSSREYLQQQDGVCGIDSKNYNAHVNCHKEKYQCDSLVCPSCHRREGYVIRALATQTIFVIFGFGLGIY